MKKIPFLTILCFFVTTQQAIYHASKDSETCTVFAHHTEIFKSHISLETNTAYLNVNGTFLEIKNKSIVECLDEEVNKKILLSIATHAPLGLYLQKFKLIQDAWKKCTHTQIDVN